MASKLPLPDVCTHGHDWSPIAAASNQSVIAGVLAGFLFAGIVVVLSQRTSRHQDSTRALKLMLTAFLGLVVTSYLYATLAGEEACPRAETEAVLNGGVLGTCGLVLIASLTWLVLAYHRDVKILAFLRGLVYFASLFVVLLLCVSSTGYIDAELPQGSHLVNNIFIYATACLAAVVGVILIRSRAQSPDASPDRETALQKSPGEWWDSAVHRAAIWTLAYLAASSVADGIVEAVPARLWYPPPPWVAYASAWVALAAPLAVLLVVTCALARADSPPDVESAASAGTREGVVASPKLETQALEAGQ